LFHHQRGGRTGGSEKIDGLGSFADDEYGTFGIVGSDSWARPSQSTFDRVELPSAATDDKFSKEPD
jgi:hypothetical protein